MPRVSTEVLLLLDLTRDFLSLSQTGSGDAARMVDADCEPRRMPLGRSLRRVPESQAGPRE